MIQLVYLLALIVLIIASYTDFRKREVPDWLNYGLIFAGVGINGIASLVFYDYHYVLYSLAGLALGVAIAMGMFYAGQWGGGDSKLFGIRCFDRIDFQHQCILCFIPCKHLYGWGCLWICLEPGACFQELEEFCHNIQEAMEREKKQDCKILVP